MVAGTPPIIERPALTGTELPDIPRSLIDNTSNALTPLEFGEEIMGLLQFMSDLTITQSTLINTLGVTAEEIISFNKVRAAVEHRLLSIRVLPPSNSPRNQLEAAVYETCQCAALMCSNCIFRYFTPKSVAFRGLRAGMITALAKVEALVELQPARDFDELLLWGYFIGGMMSTSVDTEWFASRVAKSMLHLGLEGWSDVEKCLARCLWAEKMQTKYCIAFWQEVGRCRRLFNR
jgi:hypothetical protein